MNKLVAIGVACAIVIALSCVAIVYSNDHQARLNAAKTSEVQNLQKQLKDAKEDLRVHDATNTAALHNAGQQILTQNQKIATICFQVKTARLLQPLCK